MGAGGPAALMAARAGAQGCSAPAPQREGHALPPPFRIAVVETNDLMRQLLVRWLEGAGLSAEPVRREGLAGRRFDLVIADVPGPRGVAALVRSVRAVHTGPLILLSARFGRGPALAGLLAQHGLAAALAKPLSCEELLQAVRAALP